MKAMRVICGTANPPLGDAVVGHIGVGSGRCALERSPDGEVRATVENVAACDVYVVQPTSPPVAEHLFELLLLLDACRRAGASRVTAVVPYFGYARQDRRTADGEAIGARVAAEAIARAGADRMIVVDPHTPVLEAMCAIPVEVLTAVPLLAHELAPALIGHGVVVAPDLGAGERAEHFASAMRASVAVVRKHRESETSVKALDLLGDVAGCPVALVDDMINTGATIEAAARLVRYHAHDIVAAATHGPLIAGVASRLHRLGLRRIVVTDSVLHREELGAIEVCSIAPLLAEAVLRQHHASPWTAMQRLSAWGAGPERG
ncbi:ribose-phosphate diphosphokinase [Nocardia australiensis]|uniref:ribose-phosphate diphosphokinase n=1 Tax=Nocardia australiensis TaxID=2887191 RepID=UPI001D14E0AA|nr:ribose-phosphate diphosphokinase [Nocardia australiensis]